MLNKVLGVLGVLVVVLTVVGYFAFDSQLRENSNLLGKDMAVLTGPLVPGSVIKEENITAKRVKREQIVPNAIEYKDKDLIIGKVTLFDMYANEQLVATRLVDGSKYYPKDAKLITFTTNLVDSVGANVKEGDIVDMWLRARPEFPNRKEPQKIFSHVRIEQLKTQNNNQVSKEQNGVPYLCSIYLTDEQVAIFRTLVPDAANPEVFFTLYGNQVQVKTETYNSK